jgi:nicotinate-nucleotide--dimethylbenzimidazole phosphoribosyltransferase
MKKGAELVSLEHANGCNVIGFGEMGIGNTSSASLLMHKFTGIPIEECTGRGTGHDDEGLQRKKQILQKAADKYHVTDPLDILATYGGLEIAMLAGAMIEAKRLEMIILVDGFITTAAFLAAQAMEQDLKTNAIFCHESGETGHKHMLAYLGVKALVNLGMRLGEGTGAAVCYPIIQSAVNFLNEMASFEEAGVSNTGEEVAV